MNSVPFSHAGCHDAGHCTLSLSVGQTAVHFCISMRTEDKVTNDRQNARFHHCCTEFDMRRTVLQYDERENRPFSAIATKQFMMKPHAKNPRGQRLNAASEFYFTRADIGPNASAEM